MCANEFLTAAINTRINHVECVSPAFGGLHWLYSKIYESCEDWYDRFAERMVALGVALPTFRFTQTAPTSRDRIADVLNDLTIVKTALHKYRPEADAQTQSLIDEALLDVDTFIWKLKSSH
jgi:DNA-binding ferritin-like protein